MPRLTLASTSRYRRELLERLRLPFDVARPEVDETALPGESPLALATRLAEAKAQAVAQALGDDGWALGSDQVADLGGKALGKPGGRDAAIAQLRAMSGGVVHFHTALCLAHADGRALAAIDLTEVRFRALTDAEIERYVDAEQPFDCAGSFKSEGLGIALFSRLEGDDPNSLVGLPLIRLVAMLEHYGVQVLGEALR